MTKGTRKGAFCYSVPFNRSLIEAQLFLDVVCVLFNSWGFSKNNRLVYKVGVEIFYSLLISFFILGLIIGSFLNVVLFRFNTGMGLGGRSKCFSCRRELGPIDLVPVLSFLAFRGRCRTCKSKVSWQYPAVELLTGALFASTFAVFGQRIFTPFFFPGQFAIQMLFALTAMSLLVLIVVYDIRHKIIPDLFAFLFAALSFVGLFLRFDGQGWLHVAMPSITALSAGLILAFPFYFLWRVSSGKWMGLGDAKLALGIGWFLGIERGGTAIIFGFWVGAAISIVLLALGKLFSMDIFVEDRSISRLLKKLHISIPRLSMKSEIPFAPFLVAGLLIVFFFGYNMFSVFN